MGMPTAERKRAPEEGVRHEHDIRAITGGQQARANAMERGRADIRVHTRSHEHTDERAAAGRRPTRAQQ